MLLSPNLSLDYIDVNAAQREVVHNSAVRALDALVQLAVLDRDLATPPGSPSDGQRWIVAASPTGAWAGHATQVAAWQDGAWRFYVPRLGWLVYVIDEGKLVAWSGSAWVDALSMLTTLQNLALLGVGTTADSTNPFSAKLNNTLWAAKTVAEGGDGNLRYKLSKESAAKTLSLLMQTNFSGRAEIGLTGDDDFHFKVSSDGSTWIDAIKVAGASGAVAITAANALALAAGRQGATNPALWVDASAASCVTGLSIAAKAAGSRLLLAVGSTGVDEGLSIDARGAGTIRLGAGSTGAIEHSRNAVPTASDGAALGTTSLMWSDLFLASGAVVNFDNGDVTITHASNQLAFAGAATSYSFDSLLDVSASAAGQIKFPATQNASSDVNTLDDYEEGTFTPNVKNGASSPTWSTRTGFYRKVGGMVTAWFTCDAGNSGTAGTQLNLSGLPFAVTGVSSTHIIGMAGGSGGVNMNITGHGDFYIGDTGQTQQLTYVSGVIVYPAA
jgi:hypothetical protein